MDDNHFTDAQRHNIAALDHALEKLALIDPSDALADRQIAGQAILSGDWEVAHAIFQQAEHRFMAAMN